MVNTSEETSTLARLEATAETDAGGSTSVCGVERAMESNNNSCSNAEGEANGELVCEVVETTKHSSSDSERDPNALSGGESSSGSCSCSGSETCTGTCGAVSVAAEFINGSNNHDDREANTEKGAEVNEAPAEFG